LTCDITAYFPAKRGKSLPRVTAGHGPDDYPRDTKIRAADLLVINKVAQASPDVVQTSLSLHESLNPRSLLTQSDLELAVENADALQGKAVLVIERTARRSHTAAWPTRRVWSLPNSAV
jgi:predicted GTPase